MINTVNRVWKSEPNLRFEPQKPTNVDDKVVIYFRGIKAAEKILQKLPVQYVREELIYQMSGPRIDNAAISIYSNHAENVLEKFVVTLFEMRFLDWANKHSRSFTSEQLNNYYDSSWMKDKMTINGQLTREGKIYLKDLVNNLDDLAHMILQLDLEMESVSTSASPPSLEYISDEDIQANTNQSEWVIGGYQPRNLYTRKSDHEVIQALKQYDAVINDEYSDGTGTTTQISTTLIKHDDGFMEKVSKKNKNKKKRRK